MDKRKAAAKSLQSLSSLLALLMTGSLFFFILSWVWSFEEIESQETTTEMVDSDQNTKSKATLWDGDLSKGKALFLSNCASCHSNKMDRDMTGPALKGVLTRWEQDSSQIFAFIKNSQSFIFSEMPKAKYAKDLYHKNDKRLMPPFPNLSEKDLINLLAFIDN